MENTAQDDLKAHLMETNEQFRQLAQQHSEYDHELQELESKHALTNEEQMREVQLKKLKLRLKDQMAEMVSRYKAQHAA
jgi:uncharacterized protein YdcH (DUF465 family)